MVSQDNLNILQGGINLCKNVGFCKKKHEGSPLIQPNIYITVTGA